VVVSDLDAGHTVVVPKDRITAKMLSPIPTTA